MEGLDLAALLFGDPRPPAGSISAISSRCACRDDASWPDLFRPSRFHWHDNANVYRDAGDKPGMTIPERRANRFSSVPGELRAIVANVPLRVALLCRASHRGGVKIRITAAQTRMQAARDRALEMMVNPMAVNFLGFAASLAVLATFLMRTMLPLRAIAIGSNVLFIAYGYCAHLPPVLCLHIALLPINIARLSASRERPFNKIVLPRWPLLRPTTTVPDAQGPRDGGRL